MVQLMKSGKLLSDRETAPCRDKISVKLEIEDPLEEEHGSLRKRMKPSSDQLEQLSSSKSASISSPPPFNILNEPCPLGLRLKKSPSLLDLIQMKLSQGSVSIANVQNETVSSGMKRESEGVAASSTTDKLKASNFPATLLRIGSWEYKSKYEGDLVAKCYFAKHKLVWEVLEGGLKSKVEIQWSDIMALKANYTDDGPGTLTVVLARQPLFFRETNPQPRKHTLWQATSDFTDGQASKCRLHFLQCSQGMLNKHFEKLLQCDMRLDFLSRQPEIVLDSPHFDSWPSASEDPSDPKNLDQVSAASCFQQRGSAHAPQPSFKIEHDDCPGLTLNHQSREAPSPSSGSGSSETDNRGQINLDQIIFPGLRPSMSMSDFMNHVEQCLSEQITSGNPDFSIGRPEYKDILEDITQHLLNDNQVTAASDEKSLMSRVNSLCCLLQKDPSAVQNSNIAESSATQRSEGGSNIQLNHASVSTQDNKSATNVKVSSEEDAKDVSDDTQASSMSRKDSFGDLLLHLPRITSLPKFLFNISEEDSDGRAR
ncbi:hypothetical protein QN277_007155 [Acacia crassicarpa]|uniref:TRF2/HOY1 PH-like domain-containing protein n=1 Tax=Acacia crassicarpa TaxID=499986 RepID=A0AAE1M8J4_9FABA|nr:hypothetical protein QN277_007155 [Acacia crassicarpa]